MRLSDFATWSASCQMSGLPHKVLPINSSSRWWKWIRTADLRRFAGFTREAEWDENQALTGKNRVRMVRISLKAISHSGRFRSPGAVFS